MATETPPPRHPSSRRAGGRGGEGLPPPPAGRLDSRVSPDNPSLRPPAPRGIPPRAAREGGVGRGFPLPPRVQPDSPLSLSSPRGPGRHSRTIPLTICSLGGPPRPTTTGGAGGHLRTMPLTICIDSVSALFVASKTFSDANSVFEIQKTQS